MHYVYIQSIETESGARRMLCFAGKEPAMLAERQRRDLAGLSVASGMRRGREHMRTELQLFPRLSKFVVVQISRGFRCRWKGEVYAYEMVPLELRKLR